MKYVFALLALVAVLLVLQDAQPVNRPPVPPDLFKAVRSQWKTRAERVRAFDVSFCESKFNRTAVSPTGDYGYFQVNRYAHPWVDFGRIFDPFYNAFVAHRLYNAGGWSPWSWSRSCWA